MEQLTIDTGLREYAVNGGSEHGGGVLRFNPSDPNVYSRFAPCKISCKSWNSRCRRKAPLGPMPYSCWPRRISAPRGCWRKYLAPAMILTPCWAAPICWRLPATASGSSPICLRHCSPFWKPVPASARMPKPHWPCNRPRQRARARGAGMSSWRLPTRLEVGGKAYPIHSDYRDILDILHRLNDASEPEFIRWRVALALFYEGDLPRSDYPEAMQKLADF